MFTLHEDDLEYRFGDSGPKYLMRGPRASLGVVSLNPGQDFDNHYHNIMEENFYIMEGEIEFIVNNQRVLCKKGDYIHVEPTETHYLKNIGNTIAKAVFCLAPFKDQDKVVVPLENNI